MRSLFDPRLWSYDRLLATLAALIVLIGALLITPQSDTWWLLRVGQDVLAERMVRTVEPYSHTSAGNFWPNHEWLSSVLFYLAERATGIAGLAFIVAMIVVATWMVVWQSAEGPPRLRALAVIAGMMVSIPNWTLRPQVITALFFALAVWLLTHPKRFWLYPPLFLLWANFHSGVVAGGVLMVIATLVALRYDPAHRWHWLATTALCGALTLLTPLGFDLVTFALSTVGGTHNAYIEEWQPQRLSSPKSWPYLVLAAWVAWTLARYWRRFLAGHREATLAALALVWGIIALRTSRHGMIFALVAVPVVTLPWAATPRLGPVAPGVGRLNLIAAATLALLGGFLVATKDITPPLAPSTIAAVERCPGPLYNSFIDGGPILWFAQGQPVFIDNRFDPYDEAFFLAATAIDETGVFEPLFTRYGVRCALVERPGPLETALEAAGWSEVDTTPTHSVFYAP